MSLELKGIHFQIARVNKSPANWVHHCKISEHREHVIYCLWLFLTKLPGVCTWQSSKSSEIKTAWHVWSSREPLDRFNNDSSLRMGLLRSSSPILSLAVASRLRFSTVIAACWFQSHWKAGEEEMGIRQLKCHRAHYSYQDSSFFLD